MRLAVVIRLRQSKDGLVKVRLCTSQVCKGIKAFALEPHYSVCPRYFPDLPGSSSLAGQDCWEVRKVGLVVFPGGSTSQAYRKWVEWPPPQSTQLFLTPSCSEWTSTPWAQAAGSSTGHELLRLG